MKHTKARSEILTIFRKSCSPLSASDFLSKMSVNKTTIYREFNYLVDEGILSPVDFGDRKKRFELLENEHHHHLVCLSCKKISDIKIKEEFNTPSDFKVVKHSLEFFGYCSNCQ